MLRNICLTSAYTYSSALLTFIVLATQLASCSKETGPVHGPDYREQFVGTYNCSRLCTSSSASQPQIDTVANDSLIIMVEKHFRYRDKIIVGSDTVPMDASGSFMGFYEPALYKNYWLDFVEDTMHLQTFIGGLAGGTTCIYRGVKQ